MKKYLLFGLFFLTGLWVTNAQYCVDGGPTSVADSNIEIISIVGEDATEIDYTGCPAVLGVEDLTNESVDVIAGQTYTIDFTIGTCSPNTYAGAGGIWIDYNQNEIFEDGESIGSATIAAFGDGATDATITFTVPLIAEAGVTRMRAMHWEGGTLPLDPCAGFIWGSVVDFTVNVEVPVFDCQFPTSLVADVLSDSEVELSWDGGGETEWNIEYGAPGFVPGAGEELASFNTTVPTLLIDNLDANTEYAFSIQAVCVAENSFWNTISATTDCGIENAPFFENFDGTGWTGGTAFNNAGEEFNPCWFRTPDNLDQFSWITRTGNTPSNFATGPSGDFSGSGNYLYVEASNGVAGDEALFSTPLIDVSALTTPALSFYYHMRGADVETLTVEAKEQADTDWTEVFTLTGQQQLLADDPWEQAIVSLAGFEDQVIQVRFSTNKLGFNGDVSVDEVSIIESPTCFDVQDLANTNVSFDSGTLSWTDYPDAVDGFIWEVYLSGTDVEANDPLFEGVLAAGETSITVDGLDPDTSYIFVLISDCGANGLSFQNSSVEFTTACDVLTAPFFEDFDGDDWSTGAGFNNAGDAINQCWVRDPNSSPAFFWGTRTGTTGSTFATGPSSDFSGTGNYVFTESSNGVAGDEALLSTPLIDVSSLATPALSFYYHMRGADVETLTVEAKEQADTDWTEVFTLTGQQQLLADDPWEQAIVSLAGFEDQVIQVRFSTNKLGFNGDVSIDEVRIIESPTCFNAQDLETDNTSFDSATFNWTDFPDAIDGFIWEVYLSGTIIEDNDPLFEGVIGAGETSFTVDGLDSDTGYIFVLISDCGDVNGLSFQNSSVEFTTACDVFDAPFNEDFDGDDWISGTGFNNANDQIDQCWNRNPSGIPSFFWGTRTGTTASNFASGPSSDFSGTGNYVFVEAGNGAVGAEAIFTSPLINLSPLTDPATSFYYHMRGADIGTLIVEAKEDGTSDWIEVFSITGQQQLLAADPWEQAVVSLAGFEDQIVQVRFRTSRLGFNGDVSIDSFSVSEAPTCFNVTGFTISPAVTTATASWDEVPSATDGYTLEVYNDGEEVGVDTPFVSEDLAQTLTTFEIPGLLEGETYIATITSNCGVDDGFSDTIEITFTTVSLGDTCDAAIVVDGLPYTTTDDTANYSDFYDGAPGANCGATAPYLGGNDVVYTFTPDEDMVVLVTMDPTNTWSGIFVYDSCDDIGTNCLNGIGNAGTEIREFEVLLTGGEDYIFVISTWPAPQTTPYTFELVEVLCGAVGGLQTTFVGSDQIDYEWDVVPGAIGYNWAFFNSGDDPENDTPLDSGSTTDTFLVLDNLNSSTAYDFYVLSECDDDDFGNQTGPFTIVTECAPQNYPTPVENFSNANFDFNTNVLMPCWLEGTGDLTASSTVVEGFTGWGAGVFANNPTSLNGQSAAVSVFGAGDLWLVSQQIDLGDGSDDLVVTYDVAMTETLFQSQVVPTTIGLHTLNVVISTDGGNTWSDTDILKVFDNTNIPGSPQTDFLPLDGYTGIVKFGFYIDAEGFENTRFYIDNFSVILSPTCFAPLNLDSQIVGLEDVEFSWDTNPLNTVEDEWEVQFGLEGFELDSPESQTAFATGDPNVIVSGLESASDYEFYVRAVCGTDDFSDWTGPAEFRSPIVPIEIGAGESYNEVYCYDNFEIAEWLFVSTADEEIELIFNTGSVEDVVGSNDVLQIFDGFNENGILLHDTSVDGSVLAGLTFTSSSGGFYLRLTSDIVQSCEGGQGELPEIFDFDVLSETFSTPGFGKDEFSYYPNPVETSLNIQSANLVDAYELYNMSGQRLKTGRPNSNTPSINMQDLPAGVYLMKVTINQVSETFQIIKR